MLKDEQARELLLRCERIVGHELPGIRGNLRRADTRAAAVWEMLVIEAASELGTVEYEPSLEGGSPDIRLSPSGARPVCIEVAYLYPRFWREERQSEDVCRWLWAEAKRRAIPACKVKPRFDGDSSRRGPIRKLPRQQERKEFLQRPEIADFFEAVSANPDQPRACSVSGYAISVRYDPDEEGPFLSVSGLVQDAPRVVDEQHVYRVLTRKARQHRIAGPRVICVGTDQIPALLSRQSPVALKTQHAVEAAFSKFTSLSAAMIFCIESYQKKQTRGQLFANPKARESLTEEEERLLCTLNLSRWRYCAPLPKWEQTDNEYHRRLEGIASCEFGDGYMRVEVPAHMVVDAFAGKRSIPDALHICDRDPLRALRRVLDDGWVIEECALKGGNLELGDAARVVMKLVPPPSSVYWPGGKVERSEA